MKFCSGCKKELLEKCFYILKNGHIDNLCKNCRCKGCSDDKPWTFFPIMLYYDIPYIESEWLYLMKYQIKKTISNNSQYTSIFGKYFNKMKLHDFKNFGFKDSGWFNNNFQENLYDRNLFLDKNIAFYLEVLTKNK